MSSAARSLNEIVSDLLDRNYTRATRAVLGAVAERSTGGIVAQRLAELDAEAARLEAAGERLRPDNPVLRALVADLEPVMRRNAQTVNDAGGSVQAEGAAAAGRLTQTLALQGADNRLLGQIGAVWNKPNPDSVAQLVDYVQGDAWAGEVRRYSGAVLDVVQNQAIRGMLEGWGPRRVAQAVTNVTEGLPAAQANTMMRTLYIHSYRRGSQVYQNANADILGYQVRVASLDGRTCLACVALHGTRLPVGAAVIDHHNGRCIGVPVLRGVDRQVQAGEAWFGGLPEAQQLAMAGPGALEMLASGRATLRDFVGTYSDPVYGDMAREKTLREVMER